MSRSRPAHIWGTGFAGSPRNIGDVLTDTGYNSTAVLLGRSCVRLRLLLPHQIVQALLLSAEESRYPKYMDIGNKCKV
jgi:hypothetical protein